MSDRARLNAILAKLGDVEKQSTKLGSTTAEFLTAILRIIDETVLARDLIIRTTKNNLILHVAKRSLLGTSGLAQTDLSEVDSGELTGLGAQITDAFLNENATVEIVRPDRSPDPSAVGASVASLALAWAEVGTMDATIEEIASLSEAAIFWEAGADQAVVTGDTLSVPDDEARNKLRGQLQDGPGLILVRKPEQEQALVFATNGSDEALVASDVSHVSRILAATRG